MKIFTTIGLLMCALQVAAQNPVIQVGRAKTTYLVISGTVADRPDVGGADSAVAISVLSRQNDTMAIFKLIARRPGFTATNLLIPCKDTIFEFAVQYADDPRPTRYPFRYSGGSSGEVPGVAPGAAISNGIITVPLAKFELLQACRRNINVSSADNKLIFLLDNIGADSAHHYFKFRVRNNSAIPYSIDYLKFVIESGNRNSIASRTRSVKQEVFPSYVEAPSNPPVIPAGQELQLLFALQHLPLTSGEQLTIVMQEKAATSRGRPLSLSVRAAIFEKIIPL